MVMSVATPKTKSMLFIFFSLMETKLNGEHFLSGDGSIVYALCLKCQNNLKKDSYKIVNIYDPETVVNYGWNRATSIQKVQKRAKNSASNW